MSSKGRWSLQRTDAYRKAVQIWERYQRLRKAAKQNNTIHADTVARAKAQAGFVCHVKVGQREAVLTQSGKNYFVQVWKTQRTVRPDSFFTTMKTEADVREYLSP